MGSIHKWARDEREALTAVGYGKSADERLSGLRRSKRNEAKLMLLAFLPMVPLMIVGGSWAENGLLWRTWAVLASLWFIVVAGFGLFVMSQAFVRSVRRHGD